MPGVVLALFVYLLRYTFIQNYIHPKVFWLIGLFVFLSIFTLYLNLRAAGYTEGKSVNMMLGVNILRIILIFITAAVFVISGINDRSLFIYNFLTLYLFFLVFEINAVISKLRRNLKRGN